jgi:oxygen-independent coproporphyrinogen-3 oxidase
MDGMDLAHLRPPAAAYIHVPFCAHRCGYCDFTLVSRRDDLIENYLDALARELATLGTPRPIQTLFFGGGTPTHLSAAQLDRLLTLVQSWFLLAETGEFSVEANPAGLDDDKIAVLRRQGVNRVSLGVQSFDQDVLRTLERDHDEATIVTTVSRLQRQFTNVSLDLIFGVPGQSLALWQQTLDRAIALGVQHISTYGLTFERGTTFWSRRMKGALVPLADDLERAMYAEAMDRLEAAGLAQYELSNFAVSGAACRHNQTYWAGLPYFGFGPGAARYLSGRRETNHRSVTHWIKRVRQGQSPIGDAEELAPEERARETLILGLRRIAGIDSRRFALDTGFEVRSLTEGRLEPHFEAGLIDQSAESLRITRRGRFVADSIIVDLL